MQSAKVENSRNHQKLISFVKDLNKNRAPLRKEHNLPSEFNILKDDTSSNMRIDELFEAFYNDPKDDQEPNVIWNDLKYLERKIEKLKPSNEEKQIAEHNKFELKAPSNKCELERNLIKSGYESTVQENLEPWSDLIKSNRLAENMTFPLENIDVKLQKSNVIQNTMKASINSSCLSDFNKEMNECLEQNTDSIFQPGELYTPAEQKFLKAMSLEEAKAKQKELSKFRALLNMKQIKARYQNKIKSKKYRKSLRRERNKETQMSLEHLRNNEPEAYKRKLDELEYKRIEERASLKHKNPNNRRGGKWARQMLLLSKKNNPEAKEALRHSHKLNKELTQKMECQSDDSDDEGENSEKKSSSNHVLDMEKQQSASETLKTKYEYQSGTEALIAPSRKKFTVGSKSLDHMIHGSNPPLPNSFLDTENPWFKAQTAVVDEGEIDGTVKNQFNKCPLVEKKMKEGEIRKAGNKDGKRFENFPEGKLDLNNNIAFNQVITPTTFLDIKRKKTLGFVNATQITAPNPACSTQRKLIAEAFANDDILDEENEVPKDIRAEKEKIRDNLKEELAEFYGIGKRSSNDNTDLPGWGSWAGLGSEKINPKNKRVTKKERAKQAKLLEKRSLIDNKLNEMVSQKFNKRRDKDLPFVVIDESKDRNINPLQVSQLPREYNNVQVFESTLRQPIGALWNPQTVFKRFINPPVITKMGHIIKPISSRHLLKKS